MIIRRKNGNNAKDKRRKKLRRTRYGQAPDRHSRKGMKSCLLSGFALFLLVFLLVISFLLKGQLSALVGFVGIGILALAVAGLVCGIRGMKERDKNYITCTVGIGISAALILGMCGIFVRGLF